MTRVCYLCDVSLVTSRGKTACPKCGMLYPFLPGPAAAGQLTGGRGLSSSQSAPAGPFYSPSALLAGKSAAAAPGGSPQVDPARHQNTGDVA